MLGNVLFSSWTVVNYHIYLMSGRWKTNSPAKISMVQAHLLVLIKLPLHAPARCVFNLCLSLSHGFKIETLFES